MRRTKDGQGGMVGCTQEPLDPVVAKMLGKATTKPKTMLSFFGKANAASGPPKNSLFASSNNFASSSSTGGGGGGGGGGGSGGTGGSGGKSSGVGQKKKGGAGGAKPKQKDAKQPKLFGKKK